MSRFLDFNRPIDLRDYRPETVAHELRADKRAQMTRIGTERAQRVPRPSVGLFPFVLGCALGGPLQFGIYVLYRMVT